ncbi:MAG: hypothetical protein IJM79_05985 [Erysipelotrichaceae bacterium]|nr:hypothetical protein [Erysipelotrichaceae bacterium]
MKKLIRLTLVIAILLGCGYAVSHQHVHADATLPMLQHGHSTVIHPKYELESIFSRCPGCGRTNSYRIKEQMQMPTCTRPGLFLCRCEDPTGLGEECGYEYEETVPALGHNYKSKVVTSPTCTKTGTTKYTCSRCGKNYTETTKALGHNYHYEETEPTCTEDGHRIGTCTRCSDVVEEIYPALGHDFGEFVTVKPAACEEEGLMQSTCSRCQEVQEQAIPATGHSFPEEWTIVKKATAVSDGLKQKTCSACGKVIEEVIPKTIPTPVTIIVTGGAIITAGLLILKNLKAAEAVVEKTLFKPSFETKTVYVRSDNGDFIKMLKDRPYLQVTECTDDDVMEKVEESAPDLLICDALTKKKLNSLLKAKKDALAEVPLDLIIGKKIFESSRAKLDKAVEDKEIGGYESEEKAGYEAFVRFILPILKPDLKSDETLDNFGKIADLLGIPGVSTVVNVYTSGRDIKSTLEEGELGVSETATIIGDIASILGLDTVGSIAGLVGDVEGIRDAVDEESGAYEQKEGVSAAKDIVEVVSDIIN